MLESQNISLRPEKADDEGFLFELYASTRQEELESWGWPAPRRQSFLAMQFRASQARRQTYPHAEFQIIAIAGQPAGRLILEETGEAFHLIDLALLPPYRHAGLGTALLRGILARAAAAAKPVRLSVQKANPARHLYQRLGFVTTNETELDLEMEWQPSR